LQSKYHYDLGFAWKEMTGLPFVFAAWVSNKKLDDGFINEFNKATQYGMRHLSEIANLNKYAHFDMLEYYTKFISYQFDNAKKEALERFLQLLNAGSFNS
jgi:chorismate dehydratase